MKVQAVIREERLDAVVERLVLIRVRGLTAVPVKGAGRGGHRGVFRGGAYPVHFISKIRLEWFGPDSEAEGVVRAIVQFAATDAAGDGIVSVEAVEDAIRIRTGERGLDAI